MGIGSKVYNKFGINTVSLSSMDLLPELKRGNIDAVEFIRPDAVLNQRLFDAVTNQTVTTICSRSFYLSKMSLV